MPIATMGEMEARFAGLIWANEPIGSGELVKLCDKELGWKKSTTYTMLKRLCDKGLFRNEDGAVTSCVSRAEYDALKSESFVEEEFGGSLPRFLAAFTTRKKLSDREIEQLQRLIADSKEADD